MIKNAKQHLFKQKCLNPIRNKSGIALMSVLLFFLVLMLLLGSLMFRTVANLNASQKVSRHTAAFYAAESGITIVSGAIEAIKDKTTLTDNQVYLKLLEIKEKYQSYQFEMSENAGNAVTVEVSLEDWNLDVSNKKLTTTIVSKGQLKEDARTVYATIEFSYRTQENSEEDSITVRHAILVKESIKTGNGEITSVNPDDPSKAPIIATLSTKTNSINLNNGLSFPNGEIELTNPQSDCSKNLVVSTKFRCNVNETILVTEDRPVVSPEVRVNFPTLDFTPIRERVTSTVLSSASFKSVTQITDMFANGMFIEGNYVIDHLDFSKLSGGASLTVDTNDEVFIITNKLTLGTVNIQGDGKLTIYVRPGAGTFKTGSNGTIFGRKLNQEKLVIFVDTISGVRDDAYHVVWPNNSITGAYMMFDNARLEFNPNSQYNGVIYTGATNGSVSAVHLVNRAHISQGDGRALIVATNGRVLMENNSSLSGAIIAVDFEQKNGGQSVVRYDPDFVQKVPTVITNPIAGNGETGVSRHLRMGPTIER